VGTFVAQLSSRDLCKANPFVHMVAHIPVSNLRRHADSKLHLVATEALMHGDSFNSLRAPATNMFQELLERLRTGGLEQTQRGDRLKQTIVWLGVCTKPCGTTSATF
ncbi:MAG: hypothetical protein ACKPKO_20060, partial [Candidatus Fonsibacter sp.]